MMTEETTTLRLLLEQNNVQMFIHKKKFGSQKEVNALFAHLQLMRF